MIGAVRDALGSKKALGAIATLLASTWLAHVGKITGDQWTEIVKWVMASWLGAQGAVDVAKALGLLRNVGVQELLAGMSNEAPAPAAKPAKSGAVKPESETP